MEDPLDEDYTKMSTSTAINLPVKLKFLIIQSRNVDQIINIPRRQSPYALQIANLK